MKFLGLLVSKSQLALVAGTVLFISSGLVVMNKVADIRVRELSNSLKNMSPDRTAGSSLSLIARFILMRDRAAGKADDQDALLAESEILTITSAGFVDLSREKKVTAEEQLLIRFLNIFDRILGGNAAIDLSEDQRGRILEVAFLHERRREYERAIQAYNAALFNYDGPAETAAYIYLHRGFCNALSDNRQRALSDLQKAKRYDPQGELGRTATILAGFIAELESQRNQVEAMADSLDKADFYIRLAAYKKALAVLDRLPAQGGGRYYYLRGRATEELGRTQGAINQYRTTIQVDNGGQWSRKANRRLFLLASFYQQDEKVLKEAEQNAVALKDEKVFADVTIMAESLEKNEVEAATAAQAIQEINQDIETTNEERTAVIKAKIAAAKKQAAVTGEDDPSANEFDSADEKDLEAAAEVEPVLEDLAPQADAPPATGLVVAKPMAVTKKTWAEQIKKSKPPAQAIEAEIKEIKKKNQQAYARNRLRNPATARTERKKILRKHFPKVERIVMVDGNVFYGVVARRDKGVSEVLTVAGPVRIPDELVVESKTVASNSEYSSENPAAAQAQAYAKVPLDLKIQLLSEKSTRKERRQLMQSNFTTLDKLYTIDGNSYTGLVFAVDGAKTHIITVVGRISIPNDLITHRLELNSQTAFDHKGPDGASTDSPPNSQDGDDQDVVVP